MALACPRKATSQEQPGAHSPAPPQPAKADVGKKSNQRDTIAKAIAAGPGGRALLLAPVPAAPRLL